MPLTDEQKTLEKLVEMYGISSDELHCEIPEKDMIILAGYFDNVEYYVSQCSGSNYA